MSTDITTYKHCWHPSGRVATGCDACCWCGQLAYLRPATEEEWELREESTNRGCTHGPYDSDSRVVANLVEYSAVCETRTLLMSRLAKKRKERAQQSEGNLPL